MQKHPNHTPPKSESGRIWAGILILIIGFGLLARQLNFDHLFPYWLLSWPMILVVIGLIIGGNSNFKNPAGIILIGMGVLFLIQRHFDYNIWSLFFPIAIIVVGFYLLFVNKSTPKTARQDYKQRDSDPYFSNPEMGPQPESEPECWTGTESRTDTGTNSANTITENYISSTSIFSEEKIIVTSKNLQGGEVVNIFGGTDINLLHADIQGPIVIDLFQIFAGTKIIVPSHWKVHSKVVSIFGEVDDRRFVQENLQTEKKIIYLKGTSIFGGVTIKSV
ncbi:MAG TPA: LiaF domain-containing protein [Sphingobacteriaceae bacterium]|nr:LiaF domain-containing protein [Sphingobacteriaceae bacterium]